MNNAIDWGVPFPYQGLTTAGESRLGWLKLEAERKLVTQAKVIDAARALVKAKTSAKGKPMYASRYDGEVVTNPSWTKAEMAVYDALDELDRTEKDNA